MLPYITVFFLGFINGIRQMLLCVFLPVCASVCACMCGYIRLCLFVLERSQEEVQLPICVCV